MASDGGVMLPGETDRRLGLMAAARCIAHPRSPVLIKHGVRDMGRPRYCLAAARGARRSPGLPAW
jgi:hypothetical protein